MMKTSIKSVFKEIEKYLNQDITVEGWIRTSRSSKTFGFIELNDGSFFKNIQVVYGDDIDNFKEIEKLPLSSALTVKGTLVSTPQAKQQFEIKASEIIVEGLSTTDYPLQKKMKRNLPGTGFWLPERRKDRSAQNI